MWFVWFLFGAALFPDRRWMTHVMAAWLISVFVPIVRPRPEKIGERRRGILRAAIVSGFMTGVGLSLFALATVWFFERPNRPIIGDVPGFFLMIFLTLAPVEGLMRRNESITPRRLVVVLITLFEYIFGLMILYFYTLELLDWPGLWLEPIRGLALWGLCGVVILFFSIWLAPRVSTGHFLSELVGYARGSVLGFLAVLTGFAVVYGGSIQLFQPLFCEQSQGCVVIFVEPETEGVPLLAMVSRGGRTFVYRVKGEPVQFMPVTREAHVHWAVAGKDQTVWIVAEAFRPAWTLRPRRAFIVETYPVGTRKAAYRREIPAGFQPWPPLKRGPVMTVSPSGGHMAAAIYHAKEQRSVLMVLSPGGENYVTAVDGLVEAVEWLSDQALAMTVLQLNPKRQSVLMVWAAGDTEPRPIAGSEVPAYAYPMVVLSRRELILHLFRENTPEGKPLSQYMRVRLGEGVILRGIKTPIYEGSQLVTMRPGRPVIVERTERGGFRLLALSPDRLHRSGPYLLPPLELLRYLASHHESRRFAIAVRGERLSPRVLIFEIPEQKTKPPIKRWVFKGEVLSMGFLDADRFVYWDGHRIREGRVGPPK